MGDGVRCWPGEGRPRASEPECLKGRPYAVSEHLVKDLVGRRHRSSVAGHQPGCQIDFAPVDRFTARQRLADARVGHLATVTADGRPHVVPCCFVLHTHTVYSAVDAKPKSTFVLRRLQNVRTNTFTSLLVDHYEEDWTNLWWVRVDGPGRVIDQGGERSRALDLLAIKYRQYQGNPPPGPVLAIDVEHWRMWP